MRIGDMKSNFKQRCVEVKWLTKTYIELGWYKWPLHMRYRRVVYVTTHTNTTIKVALVIKIQIIHSNQRMQQLYIRD